MSLVSSEGDELASTVAGAPDVQYEVERHEMESAVRDLVESMTAEDLTVLVCKLQGQSDNESPTFAAKQPVTRGDIRVIEPLPWMEGRRRLAVVRRVDADCEIAEMMLTHPWPELATDRDAVIAGDDAGLPHPLVVECYVRGPIWLQQVRERVGVLTESLMDAIGSAVIDGDRMVGGVRPPLERGACRRLRRRVLRW
ncbi:MAG: hypothetical protein OXC06_07060 [Acidimicrobiaceae bacterium]|nr:hypothetical protein [Acidimicrobiaceae bacterium]